MAHDRICTLSRGATIGNVPSLQGGKRRGSHDYAARHRSRNPRPDTRIITFQCSTETPRVFHDQVRVNVREKDDVLKFTRMLLTDPRFFPGYGKALAPKLRPDGPEVGKAADDLHAALAAVIPKTEVASGRFSRSCGFNYRSTP
jgi:hypothetical protein